MISTFSFNTILGVLSFITLPILILFSNYKNNSKTKDQQEFLTLNQTLDFLIEHNIRPYLNYLDIAIKISGFGNRPVVSQNLYNLLNYAKDKEITIYGQKTKTINNIITIPFEQFNIINFCYKENWSDDLTSIYNNGVLKYTNLHVKKSELDKLIEKFTIPHSNTKPLTSY